MPLSSAGKRLRRQFRKRYGKDGDRVFYALENKSPSFEREVVAHKSDTVEIPDSWYWIIDRVVKAPILYSEDGEFLDKAAYPVIRKEFDGIKLSIENPVGSTRHWKQQDGTEGSTTMAADYGYIRMTEGLDGDHLDCLDPNTNLTTENFGIIKAGDVKIGDDLLGFDEYAQEGSYRKFNYAKVVNVVKKTGSMIKFTLSNDRIIYCTPGHQWLIVIHRIDRVWRAASEIKIGERLLQIHTPQDWIIDDDYKAGYITGIMQGDGCFRLPDMLTGKRGYFNLKMTDSEPVQRVSDYLDYFDVKRNSFGISEYVPSPSTGTIHGRYVESKSILYGIQFTITDSLHQVQDLMRERSSLNWYRGWVAGFFDAEGSMIRAEISIVQRNNEHLVRWENYITKLGFSFTRSLTNNYDKEHNYVYYKCALNGKWNNYAIEFFAATRPTIWRKMEKVYGLTVNGTEVKVISKEEVVGEYVAIQTDIETLVADGLASHNCFLGENENAENVYVITTNHSPDFVEKDEQKVCIGFDSEKEAVDMFHKHYSDPRFFRSVKTVPMTEFKDKLNEVAKLRYKFIEFKAVI